jgi:hypothetical protein
MTVIAWDGKTLSADRMSGSTYVKCPAAIKVHRIRGYLVGVAGEASINAEWRAWFGNGAKPEDFPALLRDADRHSTALVICQDGAIHLYQATPHPVVLVGPTHAIGSGAEAAMAVMALGHDARKAVEIASIVCTGCGNGIDTLEFEH